MMHEKTRNNRWASKGLIALLAIALVFTMMPLTMGKAFAAEDNPSVLLKGNVLKQDKTISANDLADVTKKDVDFAGVNKKGSLGEYRVNKGVLFEDLIKKAELKEGAKIEKVLVTTKKIKEGSTATEVTEYPIKWLLEAPNADPWNNGKAMLAFAWQEKIREPKSVEENGFVFGDIETGTKIFVGCFSDMNKVGDQIANRPYWIDTIDSIEFVGTAPPQKGDKETVGGSTYEVTSVADGTAAFVKAKNAKKVVIPETVNIGGKQHKVTSIKANAFTGKKIRTVVAGKNIDTIEKYAFKKSKATKLEVKTMALTKKSVKGSLKGSKIKTVKVKVGTKKVNKKYVKKYKKIFTKKNAGKKAKVK